VSVRDGGENGENEDGDVWKVKWVWRTKGKWPGWSWRSESGDRFQRQDIYVYTALPQLRRQH